MALCMTNISTPNQIETNPRHMGELSDGEAGLIRTLRLWALANAENAHFQNLILEFRQQFPHEDVLVAAGPVAAAFSQNAVELPLRRRTPPGAMAPAANTASRTVH